MQLECQQCGAKLHARDVDFQDLRATCRGCGWQLGGPVESAYRKEPPRAVEESAPAKPPRRILPPMPVHVDVTNTPVGDGSVLTVKVRPKSPLMFLATTVATVALVVGAQQLAGEWGLFALVGTFITLVLAYRNGNTCIVTVKAGALRVRYRPFWRPGVLLRARDLDQLWVEKRGDRRGHVWYDLVARSKRGGKLTLARELPDPASALHLEALVEDHLGILDVRQPRQVS